jgi:RHS repeat-associated protein
MPNPNQDPQNVSSADDVGRGMSAPDIEIPKGGGAIKGIGEKFGVNPVNGTGSLTLPVYTSPGRSSFHPALMLAYDSGQGNTAFGFGWSLSVPNITRKTDKGLPRYLDAEESDVFLLSEAEDLVPALVEAQDGWQKDLFTATLNGIDYSVQRYRPRVEGLFARIERWSNSQSGDTFWRSITKSNVTSFYGLDASSRIADPGDASHVFTWLLARTLDDQGNVAIYEYKAEDAENVPAALHEQNRQITANRYLKKITYGNRTAYYPQANEAPAGDFCFEAVFDYGEHNSANPSPMEETAWRCRPDPFSRYRSGFEVRTYRLCTRVLMFHNFPEQLGASGVLVRSTDLTHEWPDPSLPVYSYLRRATHTGYIRQSDGSYRSKSMPPVEFTYTDATIDPAIRFCDPGSVENLPEGVDGSRYEFVDLDGEGSPGILSEQAGALWYKRNLSSLPLADGSVSARFFPVETVAATPSGAQLRTGAQRLMDFAGDGRLSLVQFMRPMPGFRERNEERGWEPFTPFASLPEIDWNDPNLRTVDLDGDGLSDVLITESEVFTWYPSLGKEGFGASEMVRKPFDEIEGPALVFADGTQSIYLADASGDGLRDLVRIRNGEVVYWPNLGYGRFGPMIAMDNAPYFDTPDGFDQRRVRLGDIDGTGTMDILYLGREGTTVWFNQSGNGWSTPQPIPQYPETDNVDAVDVVDLLGNGTACLVWSSPLPADARSPLRYIDLMGGQKPHLLVGVQNNLGAETQVQYAPSTRFYLEDLMEGRPWVTRLSFPVHVVQQVTTIDHVSQCRFSSQYKYHDGYFDGIEREFRGFGIVEQSDSESYEDFAAAVQQMAGRQELAPELNQPPMTMRTWYHTGAFLDEKRIQAQEQRGYFQQQHLPGPVFPATLTGEELRECARALKGSPMRQEVYSFDGSSVAQYPYSVSENTFEVRCLQPKAGQRHGVFHPVGRESLSIDYERNPADPRISHKLGLKLDEYGNALESCAVMYGRKTSDASLPAAVTAAQQRTWITYTETDYTNDAKADAPVEAYRLRVPCETRNYEITGVAPKGQLFQFAEIQAAIQGALPIDYEIVASGESPQKRIVSQSRTLFLDNSLQTLHLGQLDSLGLPWQNYSLAFTPGTVTLEYAGKVTDADFASAGYVHFNGDANWWIPSGTRIYPADAAAHFYLSTGIRDALGLETVRVRDLYDLLQQQVQIVQAPWHTVTAVNDYRVLGPVLLTDPNKNRSAVEHDELGFIIKSVRMGKEGSSDGDTLADPTLRMEYDLFNWMHNRKPNFIHSFAREVHGAANPRWQEGYAYSNGSGSVAMVKSQAHPGKAFQLDASGARTEVDANPRWVGNGRTVLNNKGKPVKRYEPYFSTTFEYEDEDALREVGVTPISFYDPPGRLIRSEFPNGTFSSVEFDSWVVKKFDVNDTVKRSQWYKNRGSPDPLTQPEPVNDPERRAAWLTAKHADTPAVAHFDSLGRTVYAISDYGGGKTATMRTEKDLTGRMTVLYDALERQIASNFSAMSGAAMLDESAEKGRRWTFQNVLGALVKTWDDQGRQIRSEYDVLHRAVSRYVQETGQPEILFRYTVFGDRNPQAEQLNLLGSAHMVFDQAGMVSTPALDFEGNPISVNLTLAASYQGSQDWSAVAAQKDYAAIQPAAASALDSSLVLTASSLYDALNRPTLVTLPDGTVLTPAYNEANFLSSLNGRIQNQGDSIQFLKDQDYDAKGQRQFAHYGNDVLTKYFYDPATFRLASLLTYRTGSDPASAALQNLGYTYDPVGNITETDDSAQQTFFFSNAVVKPQSLYEYDAVYELIRATGRELAGLGNDALRGPADLDAVTQLPSVNDAGAVRAYTEEYDYDLLGNITMRKHRYAAQASAGSGWTQRYQYAYQADPTNRTNRLAATTMPGDADAGPYTGSFTYDSYGNMTRMPHLPSISWDFNDQLKQADLGGGGTAYYVYGVGGQRVRKVIERAGNLVLEWIYVGAVTLFRRRRRGSTTPEFQRWTVSIGDNVGLIAQVDTKIQDDANADPANPLNVPLIRYQYTNHLGSAVLETDEKGTPISYEEYHPYGTTSYRSAKPGFDLSLKRYRFSGKERDDETGLYFVGARYYASWLGRWTSADPAGFADGPNLFAYCGNNPVRFTDPGGTKKQGGNLSVQGQVSKGKSKQEVMDEFNANYQEKRGKVVTDIAPYGKPGDWKITRERPLTEADLHGSDDDGVIHMEPEVVTGNPNGGGGSTSPADPPPPPPAPTPPADSPPPSDPTPGSDAGSANGEPKAATGGEAAKAFAKGALKGAVIGLAFVAMGSVGTVIGLGLLGYGAYKLATGGYKDVAASVTRMATGKGTADDYEAVGGIVGGIAAGGIAGMAKGGAAGAEAGTTAAETGGSAGSSAAGAAEGATEGAEGAGQKLLALGRNKIGNTPTLKNFANRIGAKRVLDLHTPRNMDLPTEISYRMEGADQIHFNLEGLGEDLQGILEKGRTASPGSDVPYTSWEFSQVIDNPSLLGKTWFHPEGGAPIFGPTFRF